MGSQYKYYNVIVRYGKVVKDKNGTAVEDKSGNSKLQYYKQQYLVNSKSISNAQHTIRGVLSAIYDIYDIISIKQSAICGVINQIQNVFAG